MIVYVGGMAVVYYALIIGSLTKYHGRFFVLSALLFLGLIAVLRGGVGTDTNSYESMVTSFRYSAGLQGWEPGFVLLVAVLNGLVDSSPLVVRLVALVFFLALSVFVLRADRDELYYLATFVLPAFFFLYSMNALRIGVASALLLLMAQHARRKSRVRSVVVGVLSPFFHYSSALSLLLIYASGVRGVPSAKNFLWLLVAAVCLMALIYFRMDYLLAKFELYSSHESPNEFSGLSRVVVIGIVLLGCHFSPLPRMERCAIIGVGAIACISSMLLAAVSYAGLRFLDLFAFSIPLSVLISFGRNCLPLSRAMKVSFLLSGMFSFVAMCRGFFLESGQGATPFLPYKLIGGFSF